MSEVKRYNVRMAGLGGQGVVTASHILSNAVVISKGESQRGKKLVAYCVPNQSTDITEEKHAQHHEDAEPDRVQRVNARAVRHEEHGDLLGTFDQVANDLGEADDVDLDALLLVFLSYVMLQALGKITVADRLAGVGNDLQ